MKFRLHNNGQWTATHVYKGRTLVAEGATRTKAMLQVYLAMHEQEMRKRLCYGR